MNWRYFSYEQDNLACPCCGDKGMVVSFLENMDKLREDMCIPLIVSSGYRCRRYNEQKGYIQTHASGKAIDILITNPDAHRMTRIAFEMGFLGIGWQQKGQRNKRFIHLDKARTTPVIWSY